MMTMLPRLFFKYFSNTSFVAEEDKKLIGFLGGFISQSQLDESDVHFIGVDPGSRQSGIGRSLYEVFFRKVLKNG
jgi:ribosomal protein S18 acetylase RimI-like enzyme